MKTAPTNAPRASIDGGPPQSHWLAPELSAAYGQRRWNQTVSFWGPWRCWVRFEKLALEIVYLSNSFLNLNPSCRRPFPQTWKMIPFLVEIHYETSWFNREQLDLFGKKTNREAKRLQKTSHALSWTLGDSSGISFSNEPAPQVMWISIELSYLEWLRCYRSPV